MKHTKHALWGALVHRQAWRAEPMQLKQVLCKAVAGERRACAQVRASCTLSPFKFCMTARGPHAMSLTEKGSHCTVHTDSRMQRLGGSAHMRGKTLMSRRRTYGLPGGRHTPSHVAEPPSTETGALKSGSMSSSSRFCAALLNWLQCYAADYNATQQTCA